MTSAQAPQTPSQVVKKLEKEIAKEEKTEASRVRDLLDDLVKAEKAKAKSQKAVHKAEDALLKAEKSEVKATKVANKAIHEQEIAAANRHNAEQNIQLQKQQDAKLQNAVEEKKAKADAAMKEHETHKIARQSKLADIVHGIEEANEESEAAPETQKESKVTA